MRGLWRALVGSRCLACREVTDGPGLCPECAGELRPWLGPRCPGCGAIPESALSGLTPLPGQDLTGNRTAAAPPLSSGGLCARCLASPRPWSAVGFYAPYGGRLRELILGLKFGSGLESLALLGDLALHAYRLHRERPDGFAPDGPEAVACVPLHWRRLVRRGFNQGLELARLVARGLHVPLAPTALRKVRPTRPQSRLKARERRDNLAGAFQADPRQARDRRILLVDDVMTTGTTLETAARALLEAGAARVEVLALARD